MGGRWNSPGRSVVYASEHPATAVLEVFVHLRRAQLLRDAYVMIAAVVPDELVLELDPAVLASGWDAPEETRTSTDVGDAWFDEASSVALRVPSVVMRGQKNVLLNPAHPEWSRVKVEESEPFLFDTRLFD